MASSASRELRLQHQHLLAALLKWQLPAAAYRAMAGAYPQMHREIAASGDFGACLEVYRQGAPVEVAVAAIIDADDANVVEHALHVAKERRSGPLVALLANFALTPAQQRHITARRLSGEVAEAMVAYRWATDEALLAAARQCRPGLRARVLTGAPGLDDGAIIAELDRHPFADVPYQEESETHLQMATVCFERPAVRHWAASSGDLEQVLWAVIAGDLGDAYEAVVDTLLDVLGSRDRLWGNLSEAIAMLSQDPQCPIAQRRRLWSAISAFPDVAGRLTVAPPSLLPYVENPGTESDASALDRLCYIPHWRSYSHPNLTFQVARLACNPNLDPTQQHHIAEALSHRRLHELVSQRSLNEIALHGGPPIAQQANRRREQRHPVRERLPAPDEAVRINHPSRRPQPAPDPAFLDLPIATHEVARRSLAAAEAAAAAFTEAFAEDATAWALAFTILDAGLGTFREALDTVTAALA
jgi:hypothetical protein